MVIKPLTYFREEDNDDIVPLIDQHATRLREIYGDFYVSEIIQSAEDPKILCSKNRQFIVAEVCRFSVRNFMGDQK